MKNKEGLTFHEWLYAAGYGHLIAGWKDGEDPSEHLVSSEQLARPSLTKLDEAERANFQQLLRAAENEDLALVRARRRDGQEVALVCAMQVEDNGTVLPVPFAEMVRGNPFELYEDPTVDDTDRVGCLCDGRR